jgi:hypothetical protein
MKLGDDESMRAAINGKARLNLRERCRFLNPKSLEFSGRSIV